MFNTQLFYKIIASGVEINLKTYAILLEHLLAVGNWRKYIEVILFLFILQNEFQIITMINTERVLAVQR